MAYWVLTNYSNFIFRFPPEERLRKFGKEGTPEYTANLQKYRAWTIKCLVNTANQFIKSLRENLHCFPSSVCWLVRQIAALLSKSNAVEEKEVRLFFSLT